MQRQQSHPLEDALVYFVYYRVLYLFVCGVSPPDHDVSVGQKVIGQTVVWLVERGRAYRGAITEMFFDACFDNRMGSVGIDASDRRDRPFVLVFVPDSYANWLRGLTHQFFNIFRWSSRCKSSTRAREFR